MQPERFKNFTADYHNCYLNDCSITLIDKTKWFRLHKKRKVLEKSFKNCISLCVEYSRLKCTPACFYTIF